MPTWLHVGLIFQFLGRLKASWGPLGALLGRLEEVFGEPGGLRNMEMSSEGRPGTTRNRLGHPEAPETRSAPERVGDYGGALLGGKG